MRNKLRLLGALQPEGVNLIQAVLLIQAQHDVFHHVQATLLFPGQTFACARVTGASSVRISSTVFVFTVLRRERQTENAEVSGTKVGGGIQRYE